MKIAHWLGAPRLEADRREGNRTASTDASTRSGTRLGSVRRLLYAAFLLIGCPGLWAGAPDLIINRNSVNPIIVVQTFSSNTCEVVEGCASPGTRTLLQFTAETWNIGNADLVVGNPTNNPLFHFSPCHGHYHFEGFALYNLLDANRNLVLPGHKAAFCIEDSLKWSGSAKTNRLYDCNYQGIQQGWGDIYPAGLPCEWIDITSIPSGNYLLQVTVNPDGILTESDTNNNTVYVPVFIPTQCPPPVNDNFDNAQVLPPGMPQSLVTYNSCATIEPGEPWIYNVRGGSSLWFSWTPNTSQVVTLTTSGSSFDTLLAVYTGTSITNMSQVAANNDIASGNVQSAVTFDAVQGTTYLISVDGVDGLQGKVQLNLGSPPNDMFATCEAISRASGTTRGQNVGATKEPGEPDHDANVGGHSVWYCWTAPTNGIEVIDTIGSDFDTVLAVYTGDVISNLTAVAADDDSGGDRSSRVSFYATGGTIYHIAVDGYITTSASLATGNIILHWTQPCRLMISTAASPSHLTLAGPLGYYSVQYSTDLKQWQILTNFYLGQGSFTFTDDNGLQSVFYRAVQVPPP